MSEYVACSRDELQAMEDQLRSLYKQGYEPEVRIGRYKDLDGPDDETWADVPGYEEQFSASSYGRIWAKRRWVFHSNGYSRKIGGSMVGGCGRSEGRYRRVCASFKGGKSKHVSAHRLVAMAHLPNPENLAEVNHINGVKSDNRVSNLEWCSHESNMAHARETGLWNPSEGSKVTEGEVREIRHRLDNGESLTELSDQYSIGFDSIKNIRDRVTWKWVR